MQRPFHQKLLTYLSWIMVGLLAFGTLLDALSNAITLVAPTITYIGTIIIILLWIIAQVFLKRYPLVWITNDNRHIRITKLGIGLTLPLVGMIALLWLPLLLNGLSSMLPSQLAFVPEQDDEVLIVIATFYRAEELMASEPHREIRSAIEKSARELNYTNLRVEVEPTVLRAEDREGAEALGKQYNASMVIWGDETAVRVTVNFLNLKQPDFEASQVEINETHQTQLVNPEAYAEFITEDLPGQLTFLSLFAVGQSYYIQEDYEAAIQVIETAVVHVNAVMPPPTGAAEAYYRLGWLYTTMMNQEQAILAYDQAIEFNPDYAKAYNNRGGIIADQGDVNGAIADFTKAIEIDPNLTLAYYNRGNALYNQGDLNGAIADFTKAIELDQNLAIAYYKRGNALYDQGDLNGAITDFTSIINRHPDLAGAYYNRGNALYNQGDLNGAITDFTKAIELEPNYALAYYNRGISLYDQGNLNEAIADFTKTIELDLNDALTYYNRGLALHAHGDLNGAMADYNKAIELDPNYATAYYSRGVALYDRGDLNKAIADYNKAIELDPNTVNAYWGRGVARRKLGDFQGAIEDFRYYLELNPTAENREMFEEGIAELEAELGK